MRSKIFIIFIAVVLMLSSGCSLLDTKSDNNAQIRALETQNALLAQQIEAIQQQNQAGNTNDGAAVPQPAKGDSEPLEQKPREPESLPTEPVKSGTPIVYDGWQIIVSSEIQVDSSQNWGVKIYVKNLTENNRIFRFTNLAVSVTDDIGTVYNYVPKYSSVFITDCEANLHTVKNLEVRSGKTAEIVGDYMSCDDNDGLLQYKDPIPLEANHLIIKINDFGPFSCITVVIDL